MELADDLKSLADEGLRLDLLGELKSGKEATVHLARRDDGTLVVIKHYRPLAGKRFATDPRYQQGRFLKSRDRRAFRKQSRFGRRLTQLAWVSHEFAVMRKVHRRGVAVPEPLAAQGATVVMEFVPEAPGSQIAAPRLIDVSLDAADARRLHAALMQAVITMFEHRVVHADLSPFNVLLIRRADRLEPVIIDFPQAVDPQLNPAAFDLLRNDVRTLTQFFQRSDAAIADNDLADRLQRQFTLGTRDPRPPRPDREQP